jgi:hypothetical protein
MLDLITTIDSTLIQHDIRFYSVNDQGEAKGGLPKQQGLDCYREDGYFPILTGRSNRLFMERRASIIFVDAGYKKVDFMKPSFRILVLNDAAIAMPFDERYFKIWTESGFVFRGVRAGHHLFQAAIFQILNCWEPQWISCLDELDKSASFGVTSNCVRRFARL